MTRRIDISGIACILMLILSQTSGLPVIGESNGGSDNRRIDSKSVSEYRNSEDSLDTLKAKKNILERMLKETDDKILKLNGEDTAKRNFGINLMSRFTDHGPAASRPTKRSRMQNGFDSAPSENPPASEEDIQKLRRILAKLDEKHSSTVTAETTTVSEDGESQQSLDSLYTKLQELDIDLHDLLGIEKSTDVVKRQRDNGDYENGRYPKEFIRK